MNTNIKARLAKRPNEKADTSDYRVLCGRIDDHGRQSCGSVLGHLHDLSPHTSFNNWCFNLPSGWTQDNDGIWHPTSYANERTKHHSQLATNPYADSHQRMRAQHRLAEGTSTKNRRPGSTIELAPEVRPFFDGVSELWIQSAGCTWLPCQVRCPKCNGVNLVDVHLVDDAQRRFPKE